MALSGRKRGGHQWRVTELNGLILFSRFLVRVPYLEVYNEAHSLEFRNLSLSSIFKVSSKSFVLGYL